MMSGEIKDLDINGLDFPLAVTANAKASEHIRNFDRLRINLSLLAAREEEKCEWKEAFDQILSERNFNVTGLSFQAETPLTSDTIEIQMRKSNLFLLPLKQNCPLFGTEALAAIAAGVPVLVSEYSGLASLVRTMVGDESVVYRNKTEINTETWKNRIIQKLVKPEEAQKAATRLRDQLLLDSNIVQSHLDFINTIAGRYKFLFIPNGNITHFSQAFKLPFYRAIGILFQMQHVSNLKWKLKQIRLFLKNISKKLFSLALDHQIFHKWMQKNTQLLL